MIKIKRINVIGREVNLEPADGNLWLYKATNTKTNKYIEVISEYQTDEESHKKIIKYIKDRLK